MPAVYTRTLLPAIESALLDGHRAIASIFDLVPVLELPADEVQQLDPGFESFFSLNTVGQLPRARACASCN
jgi:molybdopterin-guanine dinucleotide biosynthesis protein A